MLNKMKKNRKISETQMHLNEESLAFYIDALRERRKPPLAEYLLLHVENCRECQNKIIDIFSFLQNPIAPAKPNRLQKLFSAEKEIFRTKRWFSLASRIAALFTVFLLLAIYFIVNKSDIANSNALPVFSHPQNTSAAKINQKNQLQFPAVNSSSASRLATKYPEKNKNQENNIHSTFSINPNLEYMVNSKSRSFVISVQSPANNSLLSEEISFAWSEFTHEAINLIILNNRNEIVYSNSVSDNQIKFKGKLTPGLYYWKLENRNELFHVGKFIVPLRSTRPKG
jgi:hypothetical protein